ncbi:hypothetical protein G7050_02535 [Dysgonomonas sp. HDW5A]|uniref:hypothetical protein n=1 Tax=Dysgonomonas sp. HDW5A TaxID=2714926 RepID=UPI00140ABAC5|nr:hypothetical protein [Dysgonomonas sp. HDW5A]QIK58776.1 hypothetical protein G7050_02535 [Dysgonomonas sp. HDW5A]
MDISTYQKAKDIQVELDKVYSVHDKLAKGFCEINIGGVQVPYSKEIGMKLYKAITDHIKEKEDEFKKL